jgi:cation diffusion facilitator family transporter
MEAGQRVAVTGIAVSGALAVLKIVVGSMAGSTSVVADGFESASDVFASGVVWFGLWWASKPADKDHPYGHGRVETLAGLVVGIGLVAAGVSIAYGSLREIGLDHAPPAQFGVWPLMISLVVKSLLSSLKFYYGRALRSAALTADAWNDAVDTLSATIALAALTLTLHNPTRFLAADHYGGFAVGLIVVFMGFHVARDASMQLIDTMPGEGMLNPIRGVALSVPGVRGVEKCFARKTGFQYHVDLHIEVDPEMTVRGSHDIATEVRVRLRKELSWVADVLVHVEPTP